MKMANSIKKFLNFAIFLGVVGAAVALILAVSQPKQYLVVGKLVVFPSSLPTAQQNLGFEVGNTVEILNGSAFQENTFQGAAENFAFARQLGNSSTIAVAFLARKNEQMAVEDALVRVPAALADYARDLYGGSPFKYKFLSDPEVSVGPVKPDLGKYIASGFGIGVSIYILFWFLFEYLRIPAGKKEVAAGISEASAPVKIPSVNFKKDEVAAEPEEKSPASRPSKMIEPRSQAAPAQETNASAPENLPVMEEFPSEADLHQEPTDEEVKERLNRLMRGEL